MKRGEKQERVFLFEGFTVDGKQVYPLSAGRRIFLKKMGNPLIHDDGESELSEDEASAEMLLACTKKGAELGSYLNNKDKWRKECDAFSVSFDEDFAIEDFQQAMMDEVAALEASEIESAGKDEARQQLPV